MEQVTRKQRQKEREAHKNTMEMTQADIVKMTEEELFKEQKKRLRRQLNSVPTFSVDMNDMQIEPNTLKKRTEIKKQKKIDEILRDIAVLPDSEYLNEDTNLRILKKMSVAKEYNRLRLSPEQEEKMEENKQKFETITNQLWFLIQDLEKRKVAEPEIGKIPSVATTEKKRRKAFDVEQEKTFEIPNMQKSVEIPENKMTQIEEKLETISVEDNELDEVLQQLEKVVQEGKRIAKEDIESNKTIDMKGASVPEDTLELLEFLQQIGEPIEQTQENNIVAPNTQTEEKKDTKPVVNTIKKTVENTSSVAPKPEKNVPPAIKKVAPPSVEELFSSMPLDEKSVAKTSEHTIDLTGPLASPVQSQIKETTKQQPIVEKVVSLSANKPKQPAGATITVPKLESKVTKTNVKPKLEKGNVKKAPAVEKQEKIRASIIIWAIVFLSILLILCITIAILLIMGYISF